jgi:tetratricopeptide (TPR) repeat protein
MTLSSYALAALLLAASAAPSLAADPFDVRVQTLSRDWAHVNYEITDKSLQAGEAAKVAAQADVLAKQNPGRAEPLVWEAIATATEAGAKGGLGGLALAKDARQMLERAEKINPVALDGSIYTSLGSLYAQVPGFPVGFGDPAKARAYLTKALTINPTGVDPNFFYGDFLLRQHDYDGAVAALSRAQQAAARPGREVADRGRKAQAAALLTEARAKQAK